MIDKNRTKLQGAYSKSVFCCTVYILHFSSLLNIITRLPGTRTCNIVIAKETYKLLIKVLRLDI